MFLYNLIDFVNQISLLRAVMKAILEIAATFSAVCAFARFLNNFAWAETTGLLEKLDICDSSLIIASCGFNYSCADPSMASHRTRLTTFLLFIQSPTPKSWLSSYFSAWLYGIFRESLQMVILCVFSTLLSLTTACTLDANSLRCFWIFNSLSYINSSESFIFCL